MNFWNICMHVIITFIDFKITLARSYGSPSFISNVVSKWHTLYLAQTLKRQFIDHCLKKNCTAMWKYMRKSSKVPCACNETLICKFIADAQVCWHRYLCLSLNFHKDPSFQFGDIWKIILVFFYVFYFTLSQFTLSDAFND